MHRKRGLRIFEIWKSLRVEFLRPNWKVEIQSWARPKEFVRYGRRTLVGLRANDVKAVSIERLCLSLLVSNNLNLKVIKFRTGTNFVNVVYFGFPMSISHIRISGYVTKVSHHKTSVTLSNKSVPPSSERTICFCVFVKHHYCCNSFFGEDHILGFAPSFPCVWSQTAWRNQRITVLPRIFFTYSLMIWRITKICELVLIKIFPKLKFYCKQWQIHFLFFL